MDEKNNIEIHKSQLYYGIVVHWLTIISCLIALVSPLLILSFSRADLLNPNLVFGAIFDGQKPAEIWESSGMQYVPGDFWRVYIRNLLRPDGLATSGIVLGFSITLLGLIPAVWVFAKKREYIYVGISVFIMALIILAMSGLINMAG